MIAAGIVIGLALLCGLYRFVCHCLGRVVEIYEEERDR